MGLEKKSQTARADAFGRLQFCLVVLAFSLGSLRAAHGMGEVCVASCPGKGVMIDLRSSCMCLTPASCFRVSLPALSGSNAMSTGAGTMAVNQVGGRYRTTLGDGTSAFDHDSLQTGVFENDSRGIWLRKMNRCDPRAANTGGIEIPCERWPELKKMGLENKRLVICLPADKSMRETTKPALPAAPAQPAPSNRGGGRGGGGTR